MPKRSIYDQLNQAIDAMLAQTGANQKQFDASLGPLARIAAELRRLPREDFRKQLRADLQRRASMATVTKPVTSLFHTATPYLSVRDAAAALEFYKQAFGAKEILRLNGPGPKIGHAEIVIGDSVIMLADEFPEEGFTGPETLGGSPVRIRLQVPDADAAMQRALAAGAKEERPLQNQFYGERSGSVTDPFGYGWIISAHIENVTGEEMQRRFDAMMKPKPKPKEAAKPAVEPLPKGYQTLTPYLVAQDGVGLIDFVKKVFGAEENFRAIGSAGGVHCEMRLGDSMLMLGGGGAGLDFKFDSKPAALHVYVEDIDAAYQRSLEAGAKSINQPTDQPYGERGASVKDAAGNFWYIATSTGPTYVPEGLHNVNVYLHPLRAEPMIRFAQRAFGATDLKQYASPDGVVHHAQIRIGTSVLEMGEAHGVYQPMKSMFYLYVPDCDAVYKRALAAGAKSVNEPKDQPYGDRNGVVEDVSGNQWCIATHVRDMEH